MYPPQMEETTNILFIYPHRSKKIYIIFFIYIYIKLHPPLFQLNLSGVKIERAGVVRNNEANILHTGWNTRLFEASRGLDFNGRSVMVRLTHLDHEPFNYHLQVRLRDVISSRYMIYIYDLIRCNMMIML